MSVFVFIVLAAITVTIPYCVQAEYNWQNYNGVVPDDAIEGGYDENGDSIYIAQAEVEEQGIIVTTLYPNVPYVLVPINRDVIKVESGIKILCGSMLPVGWLRAQAENLHVVLIDRNPVRGGHFQNKTLHVGRIFYDNQIKIGTVLSFNLDTAALFFVHNDEVFRTTAYEVLVYGTAKAHPRKPKRKNLNRSRFH